MVISAANCIENEKEEINGLNIFPVPDGDTGTNMSLTMQAGKKEMMTFNGTLGECSAKVASALLRGGRGNSGVILSLFFRGFSKELAGKTEADICDLSAAFAGGVAAAYKAVRNPTEGTILTVMRMMSEKAAELAADATTETAEFFRAMETTGEEALELTPELLPVLKQANVVDAGGKGFLTIFKGMLSVVEGNGIIPAENSGAEETKTKASADFDSFETGDIKFGYCTECIVEKAEDCTQNKVEILSSFINGIGDSVVFVEDDEIVKFHVHTNDPGKVLSACLKCGSLQMVKVENMRNQHSEMAIKDAEKKEEKAAPEKTYGFVSVVAGDGLCDVFKDLGADSIVNGGQTMNPSTEDIVRAVNATPSEIVYVLPNNKNIYMAAKQAEELVDDKKVVVLKTVSAPQGISAMIAFDPDAEEADNTAAMKEAMKNVVTAKMTFAARDSVFDGKEIREGQILGLVENDVRYVADTREECMKELSQSFSDAEVITLFYGEDAAEDEAQEMAEIIRQAVGSDKEIMVLRGGQPVYFYLISAE